MGYKKRYVSAPETAIASYNFTDIEEGTGVVVYYGMQNYNGDYVLMENAVKSNVVETTQTDAGTTTANFDTGTFNLPRIVKGTAIASVFYYANQAGTYSLKFQIKKVSADSSVTNLSSEITQGISGSARAWTLMELPLTTTRIKRGEKIRLTVKIVVDASGGDALTIGHDPFDTDGTILVPSTSSPVSSTIFKTFIPYLIGVS